MHFLTANEAQRALTLAGLLCKQGDLGKDAVIQSHDIEIVALGLHTIVILAGYALPEVSAEQAPE